MWMYWLRKHVAVVVGLFFHSETGNERSSLRGHKGARLQRFWKASSKIQLRPKKCHSFVVVFHSGDGLIALIWWLVTLINLFGFGYAWIYYPRQPPSKMGVPGHSWAYCAELHLAPRAIYARFQEVPRKLGIAAMCIRLNQHVTFHSYRPRLLLYHCILYAACLDSSTRNMIHMK